MIRLWSFLIASLAALAGTPGAARAHPHVFVEASAEIRFRPDGTPSSIRHVWRFDEAYSAFITQGLDTNGDGRIAPDELAELAAENTRSLAEFNYFTVFKVGGKTVGVVPPSETAMAMEKDRVVLTFVLPLKDAPAGRTFSIAIADPSFFVYFALAATREPITLADAPAGCEVRVKRARSYDLDTQNKLAESLFQGPGPVDLGTAFENRGIVACP